jgi:hypothetical protein
MSKRNRQSADSKAAARRSAPVKVNKPFPWGTVLASVVLGALLVGIIAYAVVNQGTAAVNPLAEADRRFDDLITVEDASRNHVNTPVNYADFPSRPPAGGEHNPLPQQCDVYTEQIAAEHAVHSMEHGAVWITYQPELPEDQVETLTDLIDGEQYGLLSPLPGQDAPIVATAWGRQIEAQSADDDAVERFVDVYADGPQTPEKGAACVGNTTTGGALVTNPDGSIPAPAPEIPASEAPAPAPEPAPTG